MDNIDTKFKGISIVRLIPIICLSYMESQNSGIIVVGLTEGKNYPSKKQRVTDEPFWNL